MQSVAMRVLLAFWLVTSVVGFQPQVLSFLDLASPNYESSKLLVNALTEVGVVLIDDIPGFAQAKNAFRASAHGCAHDGTKALLKPQSEYSSTVKSSRLSVVIPSHSKSEGLGVDNCEKYEKDLKRLREIVDAVTEVFANKLDDFVDFDPRLTKPLNQPIGITHNNLKHIVRDGLQVEQFQLHGISSSKLTPHSIQLIHARELFVAFVAELTNDDSKFFVQLPNGEVVQIKSGIDDVLMFIIGSGLEKWVKPASQEKLRATPFHISGAPLYQRGYLPPGEMVTGELVTHLRGTRKLEEDTLFNTGNAPVGNDFCNGFHTAMYMTGFTSVGDPRKECMVVLFQSFVLDTPGKYASACVGTILLGILVEYVVKVRRQYMRTYERYAQQTSYKVCLCILYGIQVALGYFAMLIAMTYSTVLFVMIVSGLVIGYALFNMQIRAVEHSDPCCYNLANEEPPLTPSESQFAQQGRKPLLVTNTDTSSSSETEQENANSTALVLD